MDSKAATVTSVITAASYFVSSLIKIFCVVIAISFHSADWPTNDSVVSGDLQEGGRGCTLLKGSRLCVQEPQTSFSG
jgi:hypothetical protein